MENIYIFPKKITKNLGKDLSVYAKGSIQEQVCSFAAKWKNDKNRLKTEKSCQNKGSLYSFLKYLPFCMILSHLITV